MGFVRGVDAETGIALHPRRSGHVPADELVVHARMGGIFHGGSVGPACGRKTHLLTNPQHRRLTFNERMVAVPRGM
jgi:hypothetical protein